jgi:hypothetical protein
MKTTAAIRDQLASGHFEFSRHAFQRAAEREISDLEIREAGAQAEIVEDYRAPFRWKSPRSRRGSGCHSVATST